MQWSPPLGCAPLTMDIGISTRRQSPQAHTEVSPLEGRKPQLGFEGSCTLRTLCQMHRRVPTRSPTSSAAHGKLPIHKPCAFNRAYGGPHHKGVCSQPLTQLFTLAGNAPSCPQKRIPTHGARTINHAWMGPQGCKPPSTAHQGLTTCGLWAPNHLWSGSHHKVCALNSHEGRPYSWATGSQMGTKRSPLPDPWAMWLHGPCTQWSTTKMCAFNRSCSGSH